MAVSWSFAAAAIISFLLCISAGQSREVAEQATAAAENGGYHHVATVYPLGAFAHWEGECFQHNNAYLTFSQDKRHHFVVISASNSKSTFCTDYYEFKVGDQTVATDSIFSGFLPHETLFETYDREFRQQIRSSGVSIYMWSNGLNRKTNNEIDVLKQVEDA